MALWRSASLFIGWRVSGQLWNWSKNGPKIEWSNAWRVFWWVFWFVQENLSYLTISFPGPHPKRWIQTKQHLLITCLGSIRFWRNSHFDQFLNLWMGNNMSSFIISQLRSIARLSGWVYELALKLIYCRIVPGDDVAQDSGQARQLR